MKSKAKLIKVKDPKQMQVDLQNYIINKKITNAGLISLGLNFHIRKFIKGLEEIYLSEELQVPPPVNRGIMRKR